MNGLTKLTKNATTAIKKAYELAQTIGAEQVEVKHLFVALFQDKSFLSSQVLSKINPDLSPVIQRVMSSPRVNLLVRKKVVLSGELKSVIRKAFELSREFTHVYVGTEHLLLALLQLTDNEFVKELVAFGVSFPAADNTLRSIATYPPGVFIAVGGDGEDSQRHSILDHLGRDLTELAEVGIFMPLVGREIEINKLLSVLSRKTKNNPVIVGDSGVGKTALVEGLAQKIASGNVPASLRDMRIVSIDTAAIVAGSKVRGELEEKVLEIIREVRDDDNIILFIDEIHTILGAGSASGGSLDIADILKPALANGELRCIGATTMSAYQRIFQEDAALSRRFQPVQLEEMTVDETVVVLRRVKKVFEEYHGVRIDRDVLTQAAKLADRYIYERCLPDKAIDLIDEACAREKLEVEGRLPDQSAVKNKLLDILHKKEKALSKEEYESALELREIEMQLQNRLKVGEKKISEISKAADRKVTVKDIQKVITDWTGVPSTTLSMSDLEVVKNIEGVLSKRIIGQSEAVEHVAKALKRSRVGISDTSRPMASLLFLGPTGVGKTELSRVVATELFGSKKNLIQVDMSEMMEPHSVSKIIGAPPGYVGFQQGGQLTDKIRRRPYSVVLFDEIEKAHSDVLNILLQILEYGQLTDSKGRISSFRNAIIIMTSNIGAEEINSDDMLGFEAEVDDGDVEEMEDAYDEMKETLMGELKNELRPEFINRLDDIIIFRSLSLTDAVEIVRLLAVELNTRLKEKGYKVSLGTAVYKFIAEKGFDKEYGARPLRRYLQDEVESLIADYILNDENPPKGRRLKTIKIGKKQDKLVILG